MIAFFTAPAIVKLKVTIPALSATVIAQESLPSASPVPWWLDLGVTIAALGLLGYILRLVFSGELVSKALIREVVRQVMADERANNP